jgi:hypothetical protein
MLSAVISHDLNLTQYGGTPVQDFVHSFSSFEYGRATWNMIGFLL